MNSQSLQLLEPRSIYPPLPSITSYEQKLECMMYEIDHNIKQFSLPKINKTERTYVCQTDTSLQTTPAKNDRKRAFQEGNLRNVKRKELVASLQERIQDSHNKQDAFNNSY
jgi:hypothetical protein